MGLAVSGKHEQMSKHTLINTMKQKRVTYDHGRQKKKLQKAASTQDRTGDLLLSQGMSATRQTLYY